MILLPQDVAFVLKTAIEGHSSNFVVMGAGLGISPSQAHASAKRALASGLLFQTEDTHGRKVYRAIGMSLVNFLIYGLRHAYPAELGGETRGIPTSYATPPLNKLVDAQGQMPLVWPDPQGSVRGLSLSPIYKAAPEAARRDPKMHELLALLDALRVGQAREKELAVAEIKRRLKK